MKFNRLNQCFTQNRNDIWRLLNLNEQNGLKFKVFILLCNFRFFHYGLMHRLNVIKHKTA